MATTTNYGWTTPDDTALVKDGAAAIRTLGSSVDTTTKNLNPSTTLGDIEYRSSTANTNTRLGIGSNGQVLTVAGGVPTWATSDDANAIQNALLTTTGDTIYASGASTPARLGIGTTGQILTVSGGVPTWATPAGGIASAQNRVNDYESTSSGTYTDLTTSQSVTLTTGTKVMVAIGACLYATTNNARPYVSYAISGATTTAANDAWAIGTEVSTATQLRLQMSYVSYQTVTAGSNTFTMKFRSAGENPSVSFFNRQIIVIDLGS